MTDTDRAYLKRVRTARIGMWVARRASRDTGPIDRLCRLLLGRMTRIDPAQDFMHDEWVESDVGFDPEELDRYQRGEDRGPSV